MFAHYFPLDRLQGYYGDCLPVQFVLQGNFKEEHLGDSG